MGKKAKLSWIESRSATARKHTLGWLQEHDPAAGWAALMLAELAGPMHELLSAVRARAECLVPERMPSLKRHLGCYDNDRAALGRLLRAVVGLAFGSSSRGRAVEYCVATVWKWAGDPRRQGLTLEENLARSWPWQQVWVRQGFDAMASVTLPRLLVAGNGPEEPDDGMRGQLDAMVGRPDVQFAIRVVLPCWHEHGEWPSRLMRRARQGDVDAIAKLLRIDKAVVGDPQVATHLWHASLANEVRFGDMVKPLTFGPVRKLEVASTKLAAAGLMALLTETAGCRLLEPDIRGLFDALAKDKAREKGQMHVLRDPHIPEDSDAFRKAIQRQMAFWRPVVTGTEDPA